MIRSGSQSGHGYQSSFAPEVASPIRGSGGAEPRPGRDSGPPGDSRLQLRDSGVAAAESRRPWIHYGERTVLVEYWTGSGRVVRPSLGAKLLVGQHSACTRFEGLTRGCGQRPGEPFALVVVHSAGVRGVEG
jgi:hypothetical protein